MGLNIRYCTFPAVIKNILSPVYANVLVITKDLPLVVNMHALSDTISLCQLSQLLVRLQNSDDFQFKTALLSCRCKTFLGRLPTSVNIFYRNMTFRGPCIAIHSYNRSQQDALFLNFILLKTSTCFGQIYCLSSGVSTLYAQQYVYIMPVMLTVC
jgi:hypothetical protein